MESLKLTFLHPPPEPTLRQWRAAKQALRLASEALELDSILAFGTSRAEACRLLVDNDGAALAAAVWGVGKMTIRALLVIAIGCRGTRDATPPPLHHLKNLRDQRRKVIVLLLGM